MSHQLDYKRGETNSVGNWTGTLANGQMIATLQRVCSCGWGGFVHGLWMGGKDMVNVLTKLEGMEHLLETQVNQETA